MNKPTDFAYHLTNYLTVYLSGKRNFSINTVKSYRDTFKLFLRYCTDELKLPIARITLEKIDRDMICGFLEYLESDRNVNPCTLNQRLGAIHAFYKYLQVEEPSYILEYQRILAIPYKRYVKPMIGYLSKEALTEIFDSVDTSTKQGRRDLTLLCVLYDTGARVQELCDLRLRDLSLSGNPYVMLTGKGRKTRYVPLLENTVKLLNQYLEEFHYSKLFNNDAPLFFNKQHGKLSRTAVNHVINKYAGIARQRSSLVPDKITPHIFRHTKAMHLCQAGVDMIYIRDILGHAILETTNIYARINVEQMRDALEKAYPELTDKNLPDWSDDNDLMDFLAKL